MFSRTISLLKNTFTRPFIWSFILLTLYLWMLFFFQSVACDISMTVFFFIMLLLGSIALSFLWLKAFSGRIPKLDGYAAHQKTVLYGAPPPF